MRDPRMSEHILAHKHQIHKHQTHNHVAHDWRIHCGVEVTELGTNKQHTLSGPGRLHLNACVCGRIESIAGRMSGDRGMREGNER
jgi:hypothetical protein